MTFIITLISLLIERFFDWSHIRQWRWFNRYQASISVRLVNISPLLQLAALVLPPAILVGLLSLIITNWLYGVLKIFVGIFILVYCFGPKNFWAQIYACIADLHKSDPQAAMENIQKVLNINFPHEPQSFHKQFTQALFIEAYKRIFAVVFWFILLGPFGAVVYRLVDLCKTRVFHLTELAAKVQNYLDWLPVRAFTFIFALAGHFTHVIRHWQHGLRANPVMNESVIVECGIAALDVLEAQRLPEDGSAEKEALALLDRVFVMALVLLALSVLMIWR
jgi:AmpE protein